MSTDPTETKPTPGEQVKLFLLFGQQCVVGG